MPARISITNNPLKFEKQMQEKLKKVVAAKKKAMNDALVEYIVNSFEVILSNTPGDTGQLMSNWNFYVTRGKVPFVPLPGYSSKRHRRDDLTGRMVQAEISRREQLEKIKHELNLMSPNFFEEGRRRITVGIRNAAPYFSTVDEGKYSAYSPLVNTTPDGYSIQSPRGIIDISLTTIKGMNGFKQHVGVRGAHSG